MQLTTILLRNILRMCLLMKHGKRCIVFYRSEKPGSGIPEFLIDYPEYSFKARLLEEYKLEGIDFLPYKQGELWGLVY